MGYVGTKNWWQTDERNGRMVPERIQKIVKKAE